MEDGGLWETRCVLLLWLALLVLVPFDLASIDSSLTNLLLCGPRRHS